MVAALAQLVTDTVTERLGAELPHGGGAPAALVTVAHEPGLSIEALRRAVGLTHSGAVRLVDRLESDGFVDRQRSGEREVSLRLTRRGRNLLQRIERARIAAVADLLAVLPDDDQRRFDHLAAKVLAAHTHGAHDLRRICRLCSFDACERGGQICPVAEAAATLASSGI